MVEVTGGHKFIFRINDVLLFRKAFLNGLQIVVVVLKLRNVSIELRKGLILKEKYQLWTVK